MSTASDTNEARRVLEGLRQRLSQLAESTLKLAQLVQGAGEAGLPEANTLLASYTVVATHQQAVTEQLARHHDLLMALNVYPLPSYPGQTQEEILLQLMRKKPEPRVEDWMARARDTFLAHTDCEGGSAEARMREKDWLDLWSWAPGVVKAKMAEYRSSLGDEDESDGDEAAKSDDGGEEDDDDDDDDDMNMKDEIDLDEDGPIEIDPEAKPAKKPEVVLPSQAISISRMLKYYHTGILPPPEPKNIRPLGR